MDIGAFAPSAQERPLSLGRGSEPWSPPLDPPLIRWVVSSEGHVLPQYLLQEDIRVNAAGCIGVLETVVMPWIDQVPQGRPNVLQQDSDPAHKAEATQGWLAQNHSRPRAPGYFATQLA